MSRAKALILELLSQANIEINGPKDDDIHVHHNAFYDRVLKEGALGLGESYMDKWWDCRALDIFFTKIFQANLTDKIKNSKRFLFKILLNKLFNFQNYHRAFEVGRKHYDLDDNLFQNMLDSRMNYTCGYWHNVNNLEEAQLAKLELICQKLLLKPGMRMLDIGCGWGGFAKYAAEKYHVEVVGITISKAQQLLAQKLCNHLPIEIRLEDYRQLHGKFDRIASIGMFEHVGFKNYNTFMKVVKNCLHENGLFLLHTIGNNKATMTNEWITKYIFPNGMIPSIKLIADASENDFVMEDWHNFGADYDKTLMAWHHNISYRWPHLPKKYDERFQRMWSYYLLSCAGAFRARKMQLWQIVFSPQGIFNGYQAPRSIVKVAPASQDYATIL